LNGVAAFLLAGGLAGCAHIEQPSEPGGLETFLIFSNPALCQPAPGHERLLSGMIAGDANVGFRRGRLLVPARLREAFGPIQVRKHDGWWTIGAAVTGQIYKLPLKRIVHALPEGGDAGDVSYVFAAPIVHVERLLRAHGFPAEIGKDVPLGPQDGAGFVMSLLPDPENKDHTILTCGSL